MAKVADRVKETTTTTGTGAYSLAGAATGFQAFSAAFVTTDTVYYCVEDGTNWEVGIGTLTSGSPWTMARTTILASSNAGAAVNWAAGTKNVICTVPAAAPGLLSREVLTAARTYYVRTDGSDSNTGLADTAGGAFLTIQKAIDTVCALDINTQTVTIQVADGTYSAGNIVKPYLGAGPVTIQGNTTTPANVLISAGSANAFACENAGYWKIKGLKLTSTNQGIYASGASLIKHSNMDFGACYCHVYVTKSAAVVGETNHTISGGGTAHVYANAGGSYSCNAMTITLTGTPNFAGGFYWSNNGLGFFESFSNTYSGSATGLRYNISGCAVIFTNSGGSAYLPGNSAGTATNGAQYT